MILSSPVRTEDPPEFTFFNTLVPQDHPSNLRRLRFPQRFRKCVPEVTVDMEMPLGALRRDGPLIVDPTQTLLVVRLQAGVFVIWRIQSLISHVYSTDGNTYIPWNELGRGAVTMDFLPLIQGVHVIEGRAHAAPGDKNHLRLRIFDFSRWSCGLLPENGAEAEQAALYKGGQDILFEGSENVDRGHLYSLGNGTFYSLVSCLSR